MESTKIAAPVRKLTLGAVATAVALLAPLAALLGQHGPAGGGISTESSRSILESVATRIDEARERGVRVVPLAFALVERPSDWLPRGGTVESRRESGVA